MIDQMSAWLFIDEYLFVHLLIEIPNTEIAEEKQNN
jgi:hypothetical protein